MHQELYSREERLLIWLRRNGFSYTVLGKMLGISIMSALRICKAKSINSLRHGQLCELGIPANLLPKKEDKLRAYKEKALIKDKQPVRQTSDAVD